MGIDRGSFKRLRIIHIISFFILVALIIADVIYLNDYNNRTFVAKGGDVTNPVQIVIRDRQEGTNTWQKAGFVKDGKNITLEAQIVEADMSNNSRYKLNKWQMRMDIGGDCYINSAWCGTVEIHQNVLESERVQRLDLRNYRHGDIKLDYVFDGDLLIPLHKGDYLIYYPSAKDQELQLDSETNLTIGFIFYFTEYPDLSNYEISYSFDRKLYEGHQFYGLFIMGFIWVFTFIIHVVSYLTFKKTVNEMEIKKSGILSMSDMYSVIYIVDIAGNELNPVVADREFEETRQKHLPVTKQLDDMFQNDCEDAYKNLAADICDIAAIKSRLSNGDTFAFEYISKTHGWRRIRLFPMDEKEDSTVEKLIFTIQDINDEKSLIEEVQKKIDTVEHANKEKSIFLANMSHEIRTPINAVIGFDTMILREAKDPAIRSYAKNINSAANMLLSLINGILDVSKLEADKMELVEGEYSFRQMMKEIVIMVKSRTEFERLEFICDVSPNIAQRLYGDAVRLKQVIINLITNAAKYTDEGSVRLAIYGKSHDGLMHLLVSVKDTGIGIRKEDLDKLADRFQRFDDKRNHSVEGTGIGLNLVTGILGLMGSDLHALSTYGEGSEFYFEIEQKIVEPEVIGDIDFNEDTSDEEEYQSLFVAPDAKVLVVDDNAMNLKVFVDLLKDTQLMIDTASSGAMALDMTGKDKYDLIFMDHMMPEMDGIETFRRIRNNKEGINSDTPVIILTANALKGAREEYEQIGFEDFLPKPIQPGSLEEMVIKHLDPAKVKKNAGVKKKVQEISLPAIHGVDVAYGLEHTGGVANYMSLLNQFAAVAQSDIEELNSFVDSIKEDSSNKEAIGNFRIKVHSMKSSANILGALKVFGVAATLEELADKGDADRILCIVPYFEEAWKILAEDVKASLPESKEKKELPDKETVDQLLHLLETSIKAYDIKNSDELVKKLSSFDWDESRKTQITQLELAVANLDAQKVVSICEELKL